MLPDIPRISVLMLTYKQENLVGRALDSLLSQKDYIYEICINDDCSPDGTWDVLQRYAQQYPDLIKPVRNERNIGIFENIEATWKRPTGDIIYRLAGDDECGQDYFRQVIGFVKENNIDYKNELFCVYGDYKQINADGKSVVYRNNMIQKHDPVKLYLRKLLSNRSACYSKKVLDKFVKVSEGRSYSVEFVSECQLQLFAEHNYYIPVIGNIYYAQIGVSAHMSRSESKTSHIETYDKLVAFLKLHGRPLDAKDINYVKYMQAYRLRNTKRALKYYLKSIDLSLGFNGLQLRRIIFVYFNRILKKKAKIH
jgi:glycosyltransferase involved in cell wall biosynthesis